METENTHDPILQKAASLADRYASIWFHAYTTAHDTIFSQMPEDRGEPNKLVIPTRRQRDTENAANHIAYMVLANYIHRRRPTPPPETPTPPAAESE